MVTGTKRSTPLSIAAWVKLLPTVTALVAHHFRRHDGFSQSNDFSFTAIQKREYLGWNGGYRVHLNPGGVTDCRCSWAPRIARHLVPHCFRDKNMLNDVLQ